MQFLCGLLVLLCIGLRTVYPQSSTNASLTTDAMNMSANSTDIMIDSNVTTSVPDTTSAALTPAPRSSVEFEESPLRLNADLATCTCDLTQDQCDINCCCDLECSPSHKLLFSSCDDQLQTGNDNSNLCTYDVKVYKDNSVEQETVNNPAVFCIWRERNVARNYYTPLELVKTDEQFNNYSDQYSGYSYQYGSSEIQTSDTNDFYKSGQILIAVFNSQSTFLSVSTRLSSTTSCVDTNPATFLNDVSGGCVRDLASPVREACDASRDLNSLLLSNRLTATTVNVSPGTASADVPIAVLGDVQTPVYNASQDVCFGVLKQVEYVVSHQAGVLTQVQAFITLSDVSGEITFVEQKHSLRFVEVDDASPGFRRSGNPGYLVGEPVLAGTRTDDYINLNGDRDQYMTMISSTPDGSCVTDSLVRKPILFGENLRSGCLLKLKSSDITRECSYDFQQRVIAALLGPTRTLNKDGTLYIASFGNSNPLQIDDWVRVIVSDIPTEETCVGVALHLEILYAKVGSLRKPQSRIIGAKLYLEKIELEFLCLGSYCQSQNSDETQSFEMVTSVAFIDVTQSAQPTIAERPVTSTKLPADFFHPYYTLSNDAHRLTLERCFALMICSLVAMFNVEVRFL